DMIKLAMISIHKEFKERNFRSRMLLQVHDELVFDVPADEFNAIKPVVQKCMQEALALPHDVPVLTEIGSGKNWLEAH
ncbi:MAG: hypothetical protein EOO01_20010, partial [Chitinophagaceae bacterium]